MSSGLGRIAPLTGVWTRASCTQTLAAAEMRDVVTVEAEAMAVEGAGATEPAEWRVIDHAR